MQRGRFAQFARRLCCPAAASIQRTTGLAKPGAGYLASAASRSTEKWSFVPLVPVRMGHNLPLLKSSVSIVPSAMPTGILMVTVLPAIEHLAAVRFGDGVDALRAFFHIAHCSYPLNC